MTSTRIAASFAVLLAFGGVLLDVAYGGYYNSGYSNRDDYGDNRNDGDYNDRNDYGKNGDYSDRNDYGDYGNKDDYGKNGDYSDRNGYGDYGDHSNEDNYGKNGDYSDHNDNGYGNKDDYGKNGDYSDRDYGDYSGHDDNRDYSGYSDYSDYSGYIRYIWHDQGGSPSPPPNNGNGTCPANNCKVQVRMFGTNFSSPAECQQKCQNFCTMNVPDPTSGLPGGSPKAGQGSPPLAGRYKGQCGFYENGTLYCPNSCYCSYCNDNVGGVPPTLPVTLAVTPAESPQEGFVATLTRALGMAG